VASRTRRAQRAEYIPARSRVRLTPGDAVRVARELQQMTQSELAQRSGIPQPTISALESGKVTLGAERAEKLARALRVHPAVLLWPQWDIEAEARSATSSHLDT
jgi:transcriptional regulator with XRE-family HTH domain